STASLGGRPAEPEFGPVGVPELVVVAFDDRGYRVEQFGEASRRQRAVVGVCLQQLGVFDGAVSLFPVVGPHVHRPEQSPFRDGAARMRSALAGLGCHSSNRDTRMATRRPAVLARATRAMSGSGSTATTRKPRMASDNVAFPVPQPISRTSRAPGTKARTSSNT